MLTSILPCARRVPCIARPDRTRQEITIPHAPTSDVGSVRTTLRRAIYTTGAIALLGAPAAGAQTDYYNTDRGRPVQIEDAYATERYAFELKLAPARGQWERGVASWGIEPEIAYGLLPRTHLEVGVPIAFVGAGGGTSRSGVAGLELSLMHNLNTETSTVPALGLRADVLAPVGNLASTRTYASFTGMMTRTYRWMRVHLNGQYTAGASPSATDGEDSSAEVSRWLAGVAVDKAFPLRSLLLIGEVYSRQPIDPSADTQIVAGAGLRLQASPTVAVDLGGGRRLDERTWHVTFGMAYAFALRGLMPGGGQ